MATGMRRGVDFRGTEDLLTGVSRNTRISGCVSLPSHTFARLVEHIFGVVVVMALRYAVLAQQHIPSLLVGAIDADPGGKNLFSMPLAHLAVHVPWLVLGDDARIIASFVQLHDPL